jgi:hypothetical protein
MAKNDLGVSFAPGYEKEGSYAMPIAEGISFFNLDGTKMPPHTNYLTVELRCRGDAFAETLRPARFRHGTFATPEDYQRLLSDNGALLPPTAWKHEKTLFVQKPHLLAQIQSPKADRRGAEQIRVLVRSQDFLGAEDSMDGQTFIAPTSAQAEQLLLDTGVPANALHLPPVHVFLPVLHTVGLQVARRIGLTQPRPNREFVTALRTNRGAMRRNSGPDLISA